MVLSAAVFKEDLRSGCCRQPSHERRFGVLALYAWTVRSVRQQLYHSGEYPSNISRRNFVRNPWRAF